MNEASSKHQATPLPVRIVRTLGWGFLLLSVLTMGFLVHQLWVTTWLAEMNQDELDDEREQHFTTATISEVAYDPVAATAEGNDPDAGSGRIVSGATGSTLDIEQQRPNLLVESAPELRTAFALIRIPSLDRLRDGWNVVEGVQRDDLKTGAGHIPWTPLPGQPGNAVVSGHRTSYGAPFRELDQLAAGDQIEVDTAVGTHVYEVRESLVVGSTDTWVLEARRGAWLTLTTCHPVLSARERLVVVAEMVGGPNMEAING